MATKHTHPVVFGRKVDGCPRCEELKAGAEPIRWNVRSEASRMAEIRAHNCKASRCGPVCTAFDW
jgi:hypothetical protein